MTNAMRFLAALSSFWLAGCATFDAGDGLAAVQAAVRASLPTAELRVPAGDAEQHAADAQASRLLAQPLDQTAAVQVALLQHRGLQARLAELGIAAADVAQAARLPNPGLRLARIQSGAEREHEIGLHWNLARLLVRPQRVELASRQAQAVQAEVAMDVLALAADVRRAWVLAVAAEETLRYARQVRDAAEASAELARRMEQVGNFNKLARAREQGFYADAALGVARAEMQRVAARERLTRLLGLWGEPAAALALPARLPDLPPVLAERPDIEREAMAQRLDVRGAVGHAEQLARQLGLTQATRWVSVFELGHERSRSNEGHRSRTWEIGLELPLFDSGDARVARAEALHRQAVHRAAQAAIDARSEVREAHARWRVAWDMARHHRDEVVPLRQRIADEQGLRYNGMLIGVFELLADARAQVVAVNAYLEALRDFWLAQADLDQAMVGRVVPALMGGSALAAPAGAEPAGH